MLAEDEARIAEELDELKHQVKKQQRQLEEQQHLIAQLVADLSACYKGL